MALAGLVWRVRLGRGEVLEMHDGLEMSKGFFEYYLHPYKCGVIRLLLAYGILLMLWGTLDW